MMKDKVKRMRRIVHTRRVVRRRLKVWRRVWKIDEAEIGQSPYFKPGRLRKNNLAQCSCRMCKGDTYNRRKARKEHLSEVKSWKQKY